MTNCALLFILMSTICISNARPIGIVAFGEVGGGKSTLCNTLVGSNDGSAFKESRETEAQTMKTVGKAGKYGSRETFLIDTPGMGDANRIDSDHLLEMAKYIKTNDESQAFVIVLNFHAPRLGNRERQLFELVSSMYPKSKWYKHIAVVWSRYYSYLPTDIKNQRTNRREGFARFMSQYFKDSVPQHEISSIPHFFVDSIEARKPNTESNKVMNNLLSWAEKLPLMAQDLPEIKVAAKTYNKARDVSQEIARRVESRDLPGRRYGLFGPRKTQHTTFVTTETRHEEQTCTDFSDGTTECTPWVVTQRDQKDVIADVHVH